MSDLLQAFNNKTEFRCVHQLAKKGYSSKRDLSISDTFRGMKKVSSSNKSRVAVPEVGDSSCQANKRIQRILLRLPTCCTDRVADLCGDSGVNRCDRGASYMGTQTPHNSNACTHTFLRERQNAVVVGGDQI